jgi:hypothetical protein
MSISLKNFDTGILIRRSLFFMILIILTLANLFTLFRGLNSSAAMEQAQIAREISRGNGFVSKSISPAAYQQASEHQNRTIPFTGFENTYHSPLNPLINAAVFKIIGVDGPRWKMAEKEMVFPLDRVIATVSTIFFLMAIGVTYLLVTRIFDPKIAAVTAILMLFCDTFWEYSLSGLPQMLMLFLFTCAIYFAYRAVEDSSEGRIPFVPALISGVFFTLLAMAHFLTVWIALGYIIFAAVAFRPRGIIGISILATLLIPSLFVMLRNYGISGTPFGAAFFNLYNGIGGNIENFALRSQTPPDLLDRGFFSTILRTVLIQTVDIIPFLGGIIVAPIFFLAILHPFKRPSIANFRWSILLMFTTSALGLAFFGASNTGLDPNQTHLLFAPIMTAYGLAFISILWSRLTIVNNVSMLRNVHYIIIVIVCALPIILSIPNKIRVGMERKDRGGVPHWPPYFAPAYNLGLAKWTTEKQIVISDQPWAVAWYADRMSIWLPPTTKEFIFLEEQANNLDTPIAGILISPSSHGSGNLSNIADEYKDFTTLVIDGRVSLAVHPSGLAIYKTDPKIAEITRRYPHRASLVGIDMVFYSDRLLLAVDEDQ